jgi:AcrR family transcriptional regulator
MSLRAEQKKRRHAKILASLGLLMKRRRFEDITMEHIARTARVSVGTLYNYFDGKDALVIAYAFNGMEPFIQKAEALVAEPPENAREAIWSFLCTYLEGFASQPKAVINQVIQVTIQNQCRDDQQPGLHKHALTQLRTLVSKLVDRGLLKKGSDPEALVLVLFSILTDLVYQYSLRPEVDFDMLKTRLERCFSIVYDGLKGR